MKSLLSKIIIIGIWCIPQLSFAILDDIEDLEGKVVVHAGDIESLNCPVYGDYDCMSWPSNLLKVEYEQFCFTAPITACSSIGCKGIIAVGKDKVPYFFELESIGDDLEKHRIEIFQCPSMY